MRIISRELAMCEECRKELHGLRFELLNDPQNVRPIENEGVAALDPLTFRSVEVYPQTVLLTGLPMRPDRCGAIVINSLRR